MEPYDDNGKTKVGDCAQRSLKAAFRYAQIPYSVALPENISWTFTLAKFCRGLGLTVYDKPCNINTGNNSVLAVYEVPEKTDENNEDGKAYHAVFCSDSGPITRYNVTVLVMGWEKLSEKLN